jgi:hypothetical protein
VNQPRTKGRNGRNSSYSENLPDFNHLLRTLYKKSHPDLLQHSHPEASAINTEAMQLLNGVLTTIRKPNQYPPQIKKDITFYVRETGKSNVLPHVLRIRTSGGECKKQLTVTFQDFFKQTDIDRDGLFKWNQEYFPIDLIGTDSSSDNAVPV